MVPSQERPRRSYEEEMVREVLRSIRAIKHGSVQLIIQDGRVVQIDKTEKLRLQHEAAD